MITPEDNLRLTYMVEQLDEIINDEDKMLSETEWQTLVVCRHDIASLMKEYPHENKTV